MRIFSLLLLLGLPVAAQAFFCLDTFFGGRGQARAPRHRLPPIAPPPALRYPRIESRPSPQPPARAPRTVTHGAAAPVERWRPAQGER